ncbi:AAA family ATPase [Ornithinibacillus scapharcae]|uniref:AAA family ATPase n=1 Tax=Ornithinibacillus scapharcae TaxID=1147159 RepID=UPI000225C1A7|nr:AAA family ATPase [Ornithinibacillus scapharcae]
MFFLQMSGFPGSGKSTLAKEIARQKNAVLIDHDVVKSALLDNSMNMDSTLVGSISYHIEWALIESNLAVGNSVILDSPCLYETMIEKGECLVDKYHCKYKYIECLLNDFDEINNRLKQRDKMPSQIREVNSEENFQATLANSKKPKHHQILTINTAMPFETYIKEVMEYMSR